ncbi:MAG: hypothetical protein ABII23_06285 [bacterium]
MQKEYMLLINRYFTPFAIVLIGSALVFVRFETYIYRIVLSLLGLSIVLNVVTALLIQKKNEWAKTIGSFRLAANLIFNILFMYYLGSFWGPLWILFLLTPVATGLYSTRKVTLAVSISVAALLLVIYGLRGMHGIVGWGQTSIHAVFIVFISMFVNSLSRLIRGT